MYDVEKRESAECKYKGCICKVEEERERNYVCLEGKRVFAKRKNECIV